MSKPIVGVIGNVHLVENRFPAQMVGERNLRAVADVTGALLEAVDGIVLTGARANAHPTQFGAEPHPAHEPFSNWLTAAAPRCGSLAPRLHVHPE